MDVDYRDPCTDSVMTTYQNNKPSDLIDGPSSSLFSADVLVVLLNMTEHDIV